MKALDIEIRCPQGGYVVVAPSAFLHAVAAYAPLRAQLALYF